MIRIAVPSALALGALAAPALAFEHASIASPDRSAPHFTDTRTFAGLMPGTISESLHFGQPVEDKPTVVYELHPDGKPHRLDLADPRDNPFMAEPEERGEQGAQKPSTAR